MSYDPSIPYQDLVEMKFDPMTGRPFENGGVKHSVYTANTKRNFETTQKTYPAWMFNPWTGEARTGTELAEDLTGVSVIPPKRMIEEEADLSLDYRHNRKIYQQKLWAIVCHGSDDHKGVNVTKNGRGYVANFPVEHKTSVEQLVGLHNETIGNEFLDVSPLTLYLILCGVDMTDGNKVMYAYKEFAAFQRGKGLHPPLQHEAVVRLAQYLGFEFASFAEEVTQ